MEKSYFFPNLEIYGEKKAYLIFQICDHRFIRLHFYFLALYHSNKPWKITNLDEIVNWDDGEFLFLARFRNLGRKKSQTLFFRYIVIKLSVYIFIYWPNGRVISLKRITNFEEMANWDDGEFLFLARFRNLGRKKVTYLIFRYMVIKLSVYIFVYWPNKEVISHQRITNFEEIANWDDG